jgi:hypothetical protein
MALKMNITPTLEVLTLRADYKNHVAEQAPIGNQHRQVSQVEAR